MARRESTDAPEYLTVAQACRLAGIGKSTFYRLLGKPESRLKQIVTRIPVIGHIRVPTDEFRAWLEGRLPKMVKK